MNTNPASTLKRDVQPIRAQARFDFNDAQISELARKGVSVSRAKDRAEAEFDRLKAQHKDTIAGLDLEASKIRDAIESGFEMKETDCEIEFNFPSKGRKTIRRLDTGAIVSEQDMTVIDQERDLPLEGEKKDAGEAPAPGGAPETTGRQVTETVGQTNVGNAIGKAAAGTEQPKIILNLDAGDWEPKGLKDAFRSAAKKAWWPTAAVKTMTELLNKCADVAAIKETLRPHVKVSDLPVEAQQVAEDVKHRWTENNGTLARLPKLDLKLIDYDEAEDLMGAANNKAIVANWPQGARDWLRVELAKTQTLAEAQAVLKPFLAE